MAVRKEVETPWSWRRAAAKKVRWSTKKRPARFPDHVTVRVRQEKDRPAVFGLPQEKMLASVHSQRRTWRLCQERDLVQTLHLGQENGYGLFQEPDDFFDKAECNLPTALCRSVRHSCFVIGYQDDTVPPCPQPCTNIHHSQILTKCKGVLFWN